MEISQKTAEEEERYKKEMEKYAAGFRLQGLVGRLRRRTNTRFLPSLCRIEAAERKHSREWEEDWGPRDRPKSPRGPPSRRSPSPERKPAPTPKAKSSRENRTPSSRNAWLLV